MEEALFVSPNLTNIILNTSKALKNKIIKMIGLKFLNKTNTRNLYAILLKLTQKQEILFYLIAGLSIPIHAQ
jgi:hypothetical protein